MIWENFKEFFHESWHSKIRPFIESDECDHIYELLKAESRRGKKISPISSNVYRCFLETPYDEMKVIMMGICPYHTLKSGAPIADGLLMGCSVTEKLQPTLEQFYNALEKDVANGLSLSMIKDPDVSYLAHQGVLMLNAALTTEINKAGSHINLWEPFIKYLFEHVFDVTGVPIIFLGKEASRYKRYVTPFTWTFELTHPSIAAYKNTEWDSLGAFTAVNKILKDNNDFTINWIKTE